MGLCTSQYIYPEVNTFRNKPGHRWEIGTDGENWIQLAQDRV